MSNNTKEDILSAAGKLFAAFGYHETSMAKIAEKAHISKGTLYWYFSGKEELFEELITTGFNIFFTNIKNIVEKEVTADRMLYSYIKTKINFLEKHKEIAKVAAKNMEIISPKMKEKAREKHEEMIGLIKYIIEKGKKEKTFRDIDPIDTAVLIIGMTNSINTNFMFKGINEAERKVDFIYDLIKNGIAN